MIILLTKKQKRRSFKSFRKTLVVFQTKPMDCMWIRNISRTIKIPNFTNYKTEFTLLFPHLKQNIADKGGLF